MLDRMRMCEHVFDCEEPDWGFTSFMRFEELTRGGYVQNDTLQLSVTVQVTPVSKSGQLDADELEGVECVAATTNVSMLAAQEAYLAARERMGQSPHVKAVMTATIRNISNPSVK